MGKGRRKMKPLVAYDRDDNIVAQGDSIKEIAYNLGISSNAVRNSMYKFRSGKTSNPMYVFMEVDDVSDE